MLTVKGKQIILFGSSNCYSMLIMPVFIKIGKGFAVKSLTKNKIVLTGFGLLCIIQ